MSWKNEPRYWKDNIAKIQPPEGHFSEALIGSDIGAEPTLKAVYEALKGPLGGKTPKALIQIIEKGYPAIKQKPVTEPAAMNRTQDGTGAA